MSNITEHDGQLELPFEHERFLSYSALKARGIRFSRQHLSELERLNQFPRRYQLSARTIGWKQSEIDAWMASRPHARGSAR